MQPATNPEQICSLGRCVEALNFSMKVVPVLGGVAALGSMGVGWDKELPPCSRWHFSLARKMC